MKLILILFIFFSFSIAKDYQEWLKFQNNQYSNYKINLDKEFSNMLKKDWKSFKSFSNPLPYKKPKPLVIPIIKKPQQLQKKEQNFSPIITNLPVKEIIYKDIQVISKPDKGFNINSFNFYSTPIHIHYDKKTSFTSDLITKESISKFWDSMNKTNYHKVLEQIELYEKNLNLNDWAKYQLIHKTGLSIFQTENKANLFTWFILVKMGYDTKVGYHNDKVYLLSTVEHNLFQVAFFILKEKKYYILTPNGKAKNIGNIYTYKGNYPKADKELSFYMFQELKLYNNIYKKSLHFMYNGTKHIINTEYSSNLINFYKTFPQSDYNIYFNTKNSTLLSNSLLIELASLVKGKTEIEAVNMLLRFVQTAFKYKTDKKQFYSEKVMFPEETINYPYSDCEDRSIMFSYLIKNLLHIDVIGIKYNDHLATAVALSSNISSDEFSYNNKQFTIADPTYINANIGVSMPQYKNSKFKVIAFK